jgi:2-polyprenyl-3-methyl-5-hydroxy-6-metoxy-1,4-benzoquinol methylase
MAESKPQGVWISIGNVVPWRVMHWLLRHWPPAYQLLRYGTPNINSPEHWDKAWARHGKDGFRATGAAPELRKRILEAIPHSSTVLDVGCGVGETMVLLRDMNHCICFGLDIAASAVSAVTGKGMQAKTAELPDIPYADQTFDAVVCTETLEHVTDDKGTIQSIRRVLKPGGVLVLSVPDGSVDEEDTHVHRFTAARLRDALSRALPLERIETIPSDVAGESPSLFVIARRGRTDGISTPHQQ